MREQSRTSAGGLRAARRHPRLRAARSDQRGAALMLSFLVLIVIVAITYQIHMVTKTDAKVAHLDVTRATMDLAIESVILQALEDLADDALAAQASEEGGPGAPEGAGPDPGADPGEGGEDNADAVDSQMDGWWTPATTTFGDVELHIFIRDEDSKYNVLNLLHEDEELQAEARDRIIRILDRCREETEYDISSGDAEDMVRAMEDHLRTRDTSSLPRTPLLNDDEEEPDRGLPLTFREFRGLEAFTDEHFYEGYDADGNRVHSIDAFFTIYSSPAMGDEQPVSGLGLGTAGYTVNLNTAPRVVLDGLFDQRDVNRRLWEEIVAYRNEPEEVDPNEEEIEPIFDEFGEEVVDKKIFDSLDELEEVYEFESMLEPEKADVRELLSLESHVFEIIVTARLPTIREEDRLMEFDSRQEREEYFRSGAFLVRSVRAVYWRFPEDEEIRMVPLLRWEVLEHPPLQVLDFPEDNL